MADSPGKRARESKKRQQREEKAARKRLRKAGALAGTPVEDGGLAGVPQGVLPPTQPVPQPPAQPS